MKMKHIITLLLACGVLLAAGCKPKPPGISDIQATSGDRHIHVRVEGGAWVGPGEDQFTVKMTGHEIIIDKQRVLLDTKESAKVPAGAKKFEVIAIAGTLTVSADGAEILKTPLGK